MMSNIGPQEHELATFFIKLTPLKLGFCVEIGQKYSPQCGYHAGIQKYNWKNEQQLQAGLKFATQISPLLNLYSKIVDAYSKN